MAQVIPFPRSSKMLEGYGGTLSRETQSQIQRLSRTFQVNAGTLYHAVKDAEHPEIAGSNLAHLLENPTMHRLLQAAQVTPFSRPDRRAPEVRYTAALRAIAEEVADTFHTPQDFSSCTEFPLLQQRMRSYQRGDRKASRVSQEVRPALRQLLLPYRQECLAQGLAPFLYGSLWYGDAGPASDVDLIFPYISDCGTPTERKALVNEIEGTINENLFPHQMKDQDQAEDAQVNLIELQGMLTDIVQGDTTQVQDYVFGPVGKRGEFYPHHLFYGHHLLLEGEPLFQGGPVTTQLQEVQQDLLKAVQEDPFFHFLLVYKTQGSLQKREAHHERMS